MSGVHAFLFADLASFTALTEAHGDEHAADLVDEFSRETAALTATSRRRARQDDRRRADAARTNAADSIRLGLALTGEIMAEHGNPAILVGMHYGLALARNGDWFGATVNLAARISAITAGDEALLSEATRDAAGPLDGVQLQVACTASATSHSRCACSPRCRSASAAMTC